MNLLSDLRVLVLNAGSSSLKFKLFNANPLVPVMSGLIDRIGDVKNSCMIAKQNSEKIKKDVPIRDHTDGMKLIMDLLNTKISSSIDKEIAVVGHRIVHGLQINRPMILTEKVIAEIRKAVVLAPLHNPPGLAGLDAAMKVFNNVPQVGVFDTAFHQTMPPHAYMYPLPYNLYQQHHIRRYGFHGTSYHYLVKQAGSILKKPVDQVNMIACHLGNGSSMCAIKGGACIDTSMGMTPLEGLMMGTRSGDIDPAIPNYLVNKCGVPLSDLDSLLNKKSGILGIAGNNDLRTVIEQRAAGVEQAKLAVDMFVYRVRKYIGAYTAALGVRPDALVFSAGIGENSALMRGLICENMKALGIILDEGKNEELGAGGEGEISSAASPVRVLVIPTDEELSIAQQAVEVIGSQQAA